ncbi:MAG: Crp/Fnr family transcriptional regulator [Bacteriovoracaceae bacterium]|nr:Crp/Fnr family transcriptional regulator [Bacteroidota bacterium]
MKTNSESFHSILNNVAKHITLTAAEKKFFCSLLRVKKLRKRQYLLQAGDVSRFEQFINTGALRAYYLDEKGHERIVQFGLEGWWIGDMASFFSGLPATLTIEAMEESELFQIERNDFDVLLDKVPKFERFFRILLSNAHIAHQRRLVSHLTGSAQERYLELLAKYPAFEQRIPLRHIASYLGVTPEFLSRMRKRLTKKK